MLTVKRLVVFDGAMLTVSTPQPSSEFLRGTPVVPGLAYGPVLLVSQEVSQAAIEAYRDRGQDSAEAAMAAYDEAVTAVADGFSAKAARAHGAATEVLTA